MIATRSCVIEMARGANFHFMYAVMTCVDVKDSEGVVETYT